MSTLKWDAASQNARRARWTSFPPDLQEDIDEAYKASRLGEGDRHVRVVIWGQGYKLDFQRMIQTNLKTGYERQLDWSGEAKKSPADQNDVIIADANGTMQWDAGSGGGKKPRKRWRPYPPDLQGKINEAFLRQNGEGAVGVTIENTEYLLNFDTMEQRNLSTRFRRKIRWAEGAKDALATGVPNAGKRRLAIEDDPRHDGRIRLGAKMAIRSGGDGDKSDPPKEPICMRCGCPRRWQGKTQHCCASRGAGQCVFPPVATNSSHGGYPREGGRSRSI